MSGLLSSGYSVEYEVWNISLILVITLYVKILNLNNNSKRCNFFLEEVVVHLVFLQSYSFYTVHVTVSLHLFFFFFCYILGIGFFRSNTFILQRALQLFQRWKTLFNYKDVSFWTEYIFKFQWLKNPTYPFVHWCFQNTNIYIHTQPSLQQAFKCKR